MTMILQIDNEVFYNLGKENQAILRAKFADPLFQEFLKAQVEATEREIARLDPNKAKSADEFLQTAKETRLILQFWENFLSFAQDWSEKPKARR